MIIRVLLGLRIALVADGISLKIDVLEGTQLLGISFLWGLYMRNVPGFEVFNCGAKVSLPSTNSAQLYIASFSDCSCITHEYWAQV